MPARDPALSCADDMKRVLLAAWAVWLGGVLRLGAQTVTPTPTVPTPTPTPGLPSTVPAGVRYATEASANANGVRVQHTADGSVWFLEASADRVGVLRGTVMTYWQLRPDDDLGANPVDFQIDGTDVWILESGQSQIPAGRCTIAKLDTVTNQITEYTLPGSIPAAFYRAPDGTWWVPITGAALLNVNFETGVTTVYRSVFTTWYADMAVDSDGVLWLADFGNNRIVRYEPGAATETFWVFFPLSSGRLNTTQIDFDDQGKLWLSQISAGRLDRFDPVPNEDETNTLDSFYGVSNPIHFDFYQGKVYVTSSQSAAAVNIIDPAIAAPLRATLAPIEADVRTVPSVVPLDTRTFPVPPTTFQTEATVLPQADFRVANNAAFPGVLINQIPVTQAYGIDVVGGYVWFGAGGNLVRLEMQTAGGPEDTSVPVATSAAGAADNRIRIDLTLSNTGTAGIVGEAFYMYSPGNFAARNEFTIAAGETRVLQDAFGPIGSGGVVATGSVRIHVQAGNAPDLHATVRSTRVTPIGASYGYALEPLSVGQSLGPGSSSILFTGARATEVSVLGIYTLEGGAGELTLVAPDGTVRGVRPFDIAVNTREEYNPAASAFGVDPEPGDIVRVSVASGSVQPYVNILDLGTFDVATSVPIVAFDDAIIPNAGILIGANDTSFVTDLFLSNPGAAAAVVSVTYYPLNAPGPPATVDVDLAPQESLVVESVLLELFGVTSGQGSLFLDSTTPVYAAIRVGARTAGADYAGFVPAIDGTAGLSNESALAFGLPQTPYRRTNLLFFNRGVEGSVTVTGFRADGSEAGSVEIPIGDHEPARMDSVFAAFGVTNQPGGRVRLTVPSGMNVYAWTVEVDGITGDVDLAAVP
jgi:streptogramin lyase